MKRITESNIRYAEMGEDFRINVPALLSDLNGLKISCDSHRYEILNLMESLVLISIQVNCFIDQRATDELHQWFIIQRPQTVYHGTRYRFVLAIEVNQNTLHIQI